MDWGPVESVFAKGMTALVNIEAEDTLVILKFKSGVLGLIEATTATRPIDLEGSISVLGSKGTIISGFAVNKVVTWNIEDETNTSYNHLNETLKMFMDLVILSFMRT